MPLLHGAPLIGNAHASGHVDGALFRRWRGDLAQADPERGRIVALEVEACLRRFALPMTEGSDAAIRGMGATHIGERDLSRVERMARIVAERYTEPIRAENVARAVGLHPAYARAAFKRAFGQSLGAYAAQHRVAHAQRLLATTDASVTDIALDAGFGSVARFYVAFKRTCGQTPRAYRQMLREIAYEVGGVSPSHQGV